MRFVSACMALVMVTVPTVAAARKPSGTSVELIRYRLPSTNVATTVPLTLKSCDPLTVVTAPSVVATAGASPQSFAVTTDSLESARIKRTLGITLQDTGTIATLNSANEDRTGAIVGSVLKTVFSLAGLFLDSRVKPAVIQPGLCNEVTRNALARVSAIDKAIATWSVAPIPADPKAASAQHDAIQTLAAERGTILTNALFIDLHVQLDVTKLQWVEGAKDYEASLSVDTQDLADTWLQGANPPSMTILWKVALPNGGQRPAADAEPAASCASQLSAQRDPSICLVRPAMATVTATLAGSSAAPKAIVLKGSPATDPTPVPMPQWGQLQLLALSAGFGSNKELSLSLDKFGRPSEMKWTSQARGESIAGTIADAAGQASGFFAPRTELAGQKAEIDALQTQQTLNRLRACREILNAGGSACPAEAPLPTTTP